MVWGEIPLCDTTMSRACLALQRDVEKIVSENTLSPVGDFPRYLLSFEVSESYVMYRYPLHYRSRSSPVLPTFMAISD